MTKYIHSFKNLYFKTSETIDVIQNNTHVHCNTQSVLLMTSIETETHHGNVQTADDVKVEILQYMTHGLHNKGKVTSRHHFTTNNNDTGRSIQLTWDCNW